MKLKLSSQKLMALAFIVIMIISTLAFALMSAFQTPQETISLPNQKIIDYELNEQQRKYLLQRGYTLMEYRYFNGCLDCIDVRKELQSLTQNSDGQIFLQELITTQNTTSSLTVTSLKGQKVLQDPTKGEIQDTICNILIDQPIWCVTFKI
jgi:hypothetical protein